MLSLDSIKLISISIEYCMSNASRFRNSQLLDSTTRTLSNIQTIKGLPSPPVDALMFGIDATNLPPYLSVENKVVWFQCPWIPRKDSRNSGFEIYNLIFKFLQHMGDKQSENDFVLIGIVTLPRYVKHYLLGKLLGENLSGPVGKYNFLVLTTHS